MCNEDYQNGETPTVKEEPMETESRENQESSSSSEQIGSSCHETMETDSAVVKPSIECTAGPSSSHSAAVLDNGAEASSSKSSDGGTGLFPYSFMDLCRPQFTSSVLQPNILPSSFLTYR